MSDNKWSLYIGRFDPFHDGHAAFIEKLLSEGHRVCVGVMDQSFETHFPECVKAVSNRFPKKDVMVQSLPMISEVVYGRNCGYGFRRVFHEDEHISATAIRENKQQDGPNNFDDPQFLESYRRVAERQYEILAEHGFWDREITHPAILIAKAHSELSEALECLRLGDPADKNIEHYSGAAVQLSDCLGILMGMEIGLNLHISEALLHKQKFNVSRPYRHGNKKF